MTNARITFLMTTYNGMPYVRDAVRSVLHQTINAWELLIVDDASTDGTREWLRTLSDSRIRVMELPRNVGQTAALNEGLGNVMTEYVARLDQDDLAAVDRGARQVAFLDSRPTTVLVAGWCHLIDEHGDHMGDFCPAGDVADAHRYLLECDRRNPIAHSAATYRASAARAVGGYPPEITYANDFGLWCRLATVGELAVEPCVVASLREHSGRTSTGHVPLISRSEVLQLNHEYARTLELSDQQRRSWIASRRRHAVAGILGVVTTAMRTRRVMWREMALFIRSVGLR